MFATEIARRFAAIACTVVMSTTCVLGAVAPAQGGTPTPVSATRLAA